MGLMKKLTSAVVASSLVLGLVGTAAADFSPAGVNAAAARMQALNVVKGVLQPDGTTDLMLGKNITRAELVTIIVRAFGQSETAKIVKGYPAFTDTADHWASGEIAVAKNVIESKGHTLGVTATTFVPNKDVTAGEAIAFLMKFLGIKADSTQSWPMDYISGAVKAGLITEADKTALTVSPNTPATRGLVFYFADQAFGEYKTADGKNVYNTYVDTQAPVVTVDSYEANTTATEVTLTGTASGQSVLHVGSTQNIVTVGADGKWSTTVKLELGENDIWVHALDAAGNAGVPASAVKITRSAGAAATVEATVPATIVAGESFELTAKAFDANKAEIAGAEFEVTVEGNVGTYDAATGTFTAADAVGTGKLTIKSGEATTTVDLAVVAGALASVEPSATSVAPGQKVTLVAKDAKGNVISSGVSYTQSSADALVDSTQGTFIASKAGTYTVTAKAGDVEKTVNIGVYSTTVAKYVVTAAADNVLANNASDLQVTLNAVDANGNVVATEGTTTAKLQSSSFEYYNTTSKTWVSLSSAQNIDLTNGTATIKVRTLSTEYGGKIAKLVSGTAGTADSTTASVTLVEQVATSISVTNDDQFLPSEATSNATTFTVTVNDQAGKAMLRGYWPVNLTLSAGSGAKFVAGGNASSVTDNVTAVAYYSSASSKPTVLLNPTHVGAAGTATVTAAATGLAGGNDAVTVQLPSLAAKMVLTADSNNAATAKANYLANTSASGLRYTAQVTDAAGVKVDAPSGAAIQVEFPDLTSTNWGQVYVRDNNAGTPAFAALTAKTASLTVIDGKVDFTLRTNKYTGALNFRVKDAATTGALPVTESATASFVADTPTAVSFKVGELSNKTAVDVAATSPTLTINAQLYDAAGNKATYSGAKINLAGVAVSATGGLDADVKINGVDNNESVAVDETGAATFNVALNGFVGAQYTLTAKGIYRASGATTDTEITSALTSTTRTTTVTVKNNVASNVAIALFDATARVNTLSTVDAGGTAYGTATITDASGRPITDESITVQIKNADGTWSDVSGQTGITTNTAGKYSFEVTPTTAPVASYRVVTSKSAAASTSEFSVGVRPLVAATKIKVNGADTQDITKGAVTAFTVSATDAHGNVVANNTAGAISVTLSITGVPNDKLAQIRSAADGLAISSQDTQTTATETVTATVSIPRGAQSVTFYVVTDAAAGTVLTLDANATSGVTFNAADVTLNVK